MDLFQWLTETQAGEFCLTVLVSMPVANTTALLASQHDCDYTFASNVVVFTTLVSMITIPLYSLLVGAVFA